MAIRAAQGQAAIPPPSACSTTRDIAVESIEVESPSLDDVFAAVTGSTLEGAAEDAGEPAGAAA